MYIFNKIKSFVLGLLLLIVATVLLAPLAAWGLIELFVHLFYKRHFFKSLGVFGEFLLLIAVLVDVLGNVFGKVPFDRILITENGYKFGSRFDTISYVLGMNKLKGTLTPTGEKLCGVLDWFDPNHCIKTVERRHNAGMIA